MKWISLFFIAFFAWLIFAFVYELSLGVLHPRPSPISVHSPQENLVCYGPHGSRWCTLQEKWDDITSVFWLLTVFMLPWILFAEGGFDDVRAIVMMVVLTPYIAIPVYWFILYRAGSWLKKKKK